MEVELLLLVLPAFIAFDGGDKRVLALQAVSYDFGMAVLRILKGHRVDAGLGESEFNGWPTTGLGHVEDTLGPPFDPLKLELQEPISLCGPAYTEHETGKGRGPVFFNPRSSQRPGPMTGHPFEIGDVRGSLREQRGNSQGSQQH